LAKCHTPEFDARIDDFKEERSARNLQTEGDVSAISSQQFVMYSESVMSFKKVEMAKD